MAVDARISNGLSRICDELSWEVSFLSTCVASSSASSNADTDNLLPIPTTFSLHQMAVSIVLVFRYLFIA